MKNCPILQFLPHAGKVGRVLVQVSPRGETTVGLTKRIYTHPQPLSTSREGKEFALCTLRGCLLCDLCGYDFSACSDTIKNPKMVKLLITNLKQKK